MARQKFDLPITEPEKSGSAKSVDIAVTPMAIIVPTGPPPGYIVRRVDIHRMTVKQSEMLASIASGLQFNHAKLENGTVVRSGMHAIQWMLENVNCARNSGIPEA